MPGAASAHPRRVVDLLEDLGALSKIRRAGLRVALDQVSPAGTEATAELLDRLKVRVVGPGNKLQGGVFPHAPEPTADNLRAFGPRVRRHGADMGFAQDPDCDRLAIVDERGRYIGEEYTLVLAARALGELGGLRRGANIAVNLSTSRMIDDVAARFGARVVRTPVGEANVVAGMREGGSVIGGEGNGGVIWAGVTYIRDSLSAIGLALALRALGKKPLSALVGEMPSYAIVKRKVDLARKEDAAPAVRALGKAFADQKVDVQDGVRIDWLDRGAWVHVRASNTEPIMRLIAEAPDAAQANALLDQAAKVIARG
jgi:phosphomannomutase